MIDYYIYGLYRYFQWRLKCNPKNWYAQQMVDKYGMLITMQRLVNDLKRRESILKSKIQEQNNLSKQTRLQNHRRINEC
jgi:hypothetical protein